ncbi:MAG: fatty acid desaturase [Alphaproteobacteria bacterium]
MSVSAVSAGRSQAPRTLWNRLTDAWWAYEAPTYLLFAGVYVAWGLLVWFHAALPWWLMIPLGGYLVALHSSLQHESIHALRRSPVWLRTAVAYAPLGVWVAYPVYHRMHSTHHRNADLTLPEADPESRYVSQDRWARMDPVSRWLRIADQTLVFHLTLGPALAWSRFWSGELRALAGGDTSHLRAWLWHVVMLGLLFAFVSGVAGMAWWQYVLLIAYPHVGFIRLRSFFEHRWAVRPSERIASVEAGFVFAFLFLWNNLHIVHHMRATMPWYRIPGFYKANRQRLLAMNGHYVFTGGYLDLMRRYAFRPTFVPAHPATPGGSAPAPAAVADGAA